MTTHSISHHQWSEDEDKRLRAAIRAAWAVPFIDDIEDYVWEAIFAYAKGVEPINTAEDIRTKLLFDIVDPHTGVGWSAKTVQCSFTPGSFIEFIVARVAWPNPELDLDSNEQAIGDAVLETWNTKIKQDAATQGVGDQRMCVLLKSKKKPANPDAQKTYIYYEWRFPIYQSTSLAWKWKDPVRKRGLHARLASENGAGPVVFRWYPKGGQLFERIQLPHSREELDKRKFSFRPERLAVLTAVPLLLNSIAPQAQSG